MTCSEVFERMPHRFQKMGLKDVHGVFQFDINGPDGGQWHAVCSGDDCRVQRGCYHRPDVTVFTNAENVVKLAQGKLNPTLALLTRKVKVAGDISLIARMKTLLTGSL